MNKITQFIVILMAVFSVNAKAQSEEASAVKSTITDSVLTDGLVYKVLLYPEMDREETGEVPAEYVNRFGETRWRREADSIQAHARSIGFPEAVAVPFYNSERISMEKARSLEAEMGGQPSSENAQKDPLDAIAKASDMAQKPSSRWQEGLVYKVQFLTSKDPLPEGDQRLRDLGNVYLYGHNDLTTYTWGRTRLPREAARLQEEMHRYGFKDAFVVHYYNGKRISLEEALTLRKKGLGKSSGVVGNTSGVIYRVQVAASNVRLSLDHPALKMHDEVSMYMHDDMFKYTVGETTSKAEAKKLMNRIASGGSSGAFVVSFLDGKRVSSEGKGQ